MQMEEMARAIYGELASGKVISIADRQRCGLAQIEMVLEAMLRAQPVLLHGTGDLIPAGSALKLSPGRARFNRPPREREGFATDSSGIALLKALFSNAASELGYPYVIASQSPLKLVIKRWKPEAERKRGYVHLIGPRSHFERESTVAGIPTWQWVTSRTDAVFYGAVEVERSDFVYPVERA
jgi:hypothetical protein